MRTPGVTLAPEAVTPVDVKADVPARDGTANARSFAELLAEAEAVRDHIEIRRQGHPAGGWRAGVQAALSGTVAGAVAAAGAVGQLARQAPWLSASLLTRGSGTARRRDAARG